MLPTEPSRNWTHHTLPYASSLVLHKDTISYSMFPPLPKHTNITVKISEVSASKSLKETWLLKPLQIFFWKVENETIVICFLDGSSSPLSNSMQICKKQNKILPSRSCTYLLP